MMRKDFQNKRNDDEVTFTRSLGLFSASNIGVGAMIGAGIFVLSGLAIGEAGPSAVIAYVLAALVTLFTALSYSELASSIPLAGGGYTFVHEAVGGFVAFIAGWSLIFGGLVACSLYALGFGEYMNSLLTAIGVVNLPFRIVALVAIVFFVFINIRGTSESAKAQNILSVLQVLTLAFFIFVCFQYFAPKDIKPFMPKGITGVFGALTLIYISFFGFELVTTAAEEIKNPEKTIPRAILISLFIPTVIYVLVIIAMLGVMTTKTLGGSVSPLTDVANYLKNPTLLAVVLFAALLATITALNSTIIAASRQTYAMGRDGYLPGVIGKLVKKFRTPLFALVIIGVLTSIFALMGEVEFIARVANFCFLVALSLVNLSVIILRKRKPNLRRPFKLPWHPIIPVVGIITNFAILVMMDLKTLILGTGWLLLGGLVFLIYSRRQKEKTEASRRLEEIIEKQMRKEYKILVSLGDPSHIKSLMSIACALAKKYQGEIVGLSAIEVPRGVDLKDGLVETDARMMLLNYAMSFARENNIPYTRRIKIGHRLSRAIVEVAKEEDCNFIVLGRQKSVSLPERILRTVVDSVLDRAPCDVAIVTGDPIEEVKRIVYAAEDSHDARYAASLLPAFVDMYKAEPIALRVISEMGVSYQHITAQSLFDEIFKDIEMDIKRTITYSTDIEEGIVDYLKRNDMLVMGFGQASFMERILFRSLAEDVSERSRGPVILIKKFVPTKRDILGREKISVEV
jgi:amino acid transporter/nucleotide-binding universal stress UspA family protein